MKKLSRITVAALLMTAVTAVTAGPAAAAVAAVAAPPPPPRVDHRPDGLCRLWPRLCALTPAGVVPDQPTR